MVVYHFTSNTKITVVHITKRTFVSSWPGRAPKIPQMLVSTNKDCPQRRASGCVKGWTRGTGEGSACRPQRRSGWHERKGGVKMAKEVGRAAIVAAPAHKWEGVRSCLQCLSVRASGSCPPRQMEDSVRAWWCVICWQSWLVSDRTGLSSQFWLSAVP